jgi:prepilin-type N-terminal cleavage/methylation domain-containing protein
MRPVAFRGQDGFTLVELMVAMSIFLLILVGIFQVFDPSRNAYQVSERKLDVQQNARVAMDRMARQIRMAGYFPENVDTNNTNDLANSIQIATESAISVAGDLDNTGASGVYTFCLDSSGLRRVGPGAIGVAGSYTCANGQLMAESVTALNFAYFDSANNPVPNPPTGPYNLDAQGLGGAPSFASVAQRSIVRRIVIMVTAREAVPGQPAQTYTLASDVRLRNP